MLEATKSLKNAWFRSPWAWRKSVKKACTVHSRFFNVKCQENRIELETRPVVVYWRCGSRSWWWWLLRRTRHALPVSRRLLQQHEAPGVGGLPHTISKIPTTRLQWRGSSIQKGEVRPRFAQPKTDQYYGSPGWRFTLTNIDYYLLVLAKKNHLF